MAPGVQIPLPPPFSDPAVFDRCGLTQREYVSQARIVVPAGGLGAIPIVLVPQKPGPCLVEIETEDM